MKAKKRKGRYVPQEKEFQKYIYKNISTLNITNLDEFIKKKEVYDRDLDWFSYTFDSTIKDLVLDNIKRNLGLIQDVKRLGKEVSLDTLGGHKIFADIIGVAEESGDYVVIEVKRSNKTERDAVTEILSYMQSILLKFPELTLRDFILVIASSEWNSILINAVANLMVLQNMNIVPLKMVYTLKGHKLSSVSFRVVNPFEEQKYTILNNFNYKCLSSIALCWNNSLQDPYEVAELVAKELDRHHISAFTIGLRPTDAAIKACPLPYQVIVCASNPYLVSEYVKKYYESKDLSEVFSLGNNRDERKSPQPEIMDLSEPLPSENNCYFPLSDLEMLWERRMQEVLRDVITSFPENITNVPTNWDMGDINFEKESQEDSDLFQFWDWGKVYYSGLLHQIVLKKAFRDAKSVDENGENPCPLILPINLNPIKNYHSKDYLFHLLEFYFPEENERNKNYNEAFDI